MTSVFADLTMSPLHKMQSEAPAGLVTGSIDLLASDATRFSKEANQITTLRGCG
jgi:hypothetical protein